MKRHWLEKVASNEQFAKQFWKVDSDAALFVLKELTKTHDLSVASGDLFFLDGRWYVTHSGLLGIAYRRHCSGIDITPCNKLCDTSVSRWAFRAVVYKSRKCKGFVGYGDADPSNVSPLVRGAEMRVAETRAVNRALRKAYGLGICSVEELGAANTKDTAPTEDKRPTKSVNGNGWNGGPKIRDRLCQLIRHHQLDAGLVKSYAIEFCGVKTLREATREQLENFIQHLADWSGKDRNALLCQLNSYLARKEGVA